MVNVKCFKCGYVWEIECAPCVKSVVCPKCGALNDLPDMIGDETEIEGDWLQCLEPTGFEWSMPAGKIGNPIVGYTYVTATGAKMTKEQYIEKFKLDPDIALEYMRKVGKEGVPGFKNLSTLGDKKPKKLVHEIH